ncbi:DUF465 domain-containing protein [Pseudomonas sp. LRF_L74]|uniref:DUF465 domain-containing protein n=1 Tax=Pseudomonas sp. LRF_L74 TaxID=3369422 RepID=UPI003F5E7611
MHIDYFSQAEPDHKPQLRRTSTGYAALAEQYDDIDRRIERIEIGIERPDDMPLSALKLQRSGLREDLARQTRKAEGGCCNCGRNCAGK